MRRHIVLKLIVVNLILMNIFYYPIHLHQYEKSITEETDLKLSSETSATYIFYDWLQESSFSISSMKLDSLDNIYIAGKSGSHLYAAKYNTSGELLLETGKYLGGVLNVRDVDIDSEGSIYCTGDWSGQIFIIKFNRDGDYQWLDTRKESGGKGIAIDSSNYVYITGYTDTSSNALDICLLKYDKMGNQLWNRTWGGSKNDRGYTIRINQSNNIYIGGDTKSFGNGYNDACILKYDTSGQFFWDYVWGGDDNDNGRALSFDLSNNIFLGGRTFSYGEGSADIFLLKFNKNGNLISNHTWGTSNIEQASSLVCDNFGNLYVIGTRGNKLLIVKFDSSLEYEWHLIHPRNDFWDVSGIGIVCDSVNNLYLAGNENHLSNYIGFVMKCNPNEINLTPKLSRTISVYTTFHTHMELFINTYADDTHTVTANFKIESYGNSLLIDVIHDVSYIQYTSIITESKDTHNKTIYPIGQKNTLKIDSFSDFTFVFYLNYTYNYRSCIEDDGWYCTRDEERTVSGEKYSEPYDFAQKTSISGFDQYVTIGIIATILVYIIRRRHKLIKRNS